MPDFEKARQTLAAFQQLLDVTPTELTHVRLNSDAWTLAEIVGHLIDSASNNHQRFARLQHGNLDIFPSYEPEPWVAAQNYDGMNFDTLATLWSSYNQALLHIAKSSPASALGNQWVTQKGGQTLDFLIDDYYAHMQIHVEHYQDRLAAIKAG